MKNIANYLDEFMDDEFTFESKSKKLKPVKKDLKKKLRDNEDNFNDKSMYENKNHYKRKR